MRRVLRILAAVTVALGMSGYTSISYYAQSLEGHVQIMAARKNVGKLIRDPSTPKALRSKLTSASAIRRFATDELSLPDNSSYRSYVDIHRDAVTWAVFAAPQFSLAPRTWCFPVFGCVPYRGYFSRKSATESFVELKRQGLDVHVTGITPYSTLGWSSDPLLSTMLAQDDTYLGSLVFHELAHQRLYVEGDSAFNEAFAVAVETTGTRKWLRAAGDQAGLRRYEAGRKRSADFLRAGGENARRVGPGLWKSPYPAVDGGCQGSHDRETADALPAHARQALGRIPGIWRLGSISRSTTQSSPRRLSTANRFRHFFAV